MFRADLTNNYYTRERNVTELQNRYMLNLLRRSLSPMKQRKDGDHKIVITVYSVEKESDRCDLESIGCK